MLECSHELWHALGIEPIIVGMAAGDHPYAAALRASGYRVIELPAARSARGLAALRRSLRLVRPDIVHIHQESCMDAVALVARSSPSVRGVVQTVHSSFPFTGNLRARRTVRAAFSRRLGVTWVACAHQVAENERARFRNPTIVVENWVDIEALVAGATRDAGRLVREDLHVELTMPLLGLIGNCDEPKNHELIPLALAEVSQPIHVLHVGEARGMPMVEAAAWRRCPKRHVVHNLGPRDDIPRLLASCDLVLVPSRREGLPLVPIEALCAGVPVLAAEVPALEWLSAFPSAMLAPPEPSPWGKAIDAALARDWGRDLTDSSKAALARFEPSRGVAEYNSVYLDALRGIPPPANDPDISANRIRRRMVDPDNTSIRPHSIPDDRGSLDGVGSPWDSNC
jgi:glycosyltransferase involved in cell wall biosynthesis